MKNSICLVVSLFLSLVPGTSIAYGASINESVFQQYQFESNLLQLIDSQQYSYEEKVIIVKVKDSKTTQAWAQVKIASTDGTDELGPYSVDEDVPLRVDIDERDWEVVVLEQSLDSSVTYLIE